MASGVVALVDVCETVLALESRDRDVVALSMLSKLAEMHESAPDASGHSAAGVIDVAILGSWGNVRRVPDDVDELVMAEEGWDVHGDTSFSPDGGGEALRGTSGKGLLAYSPA